MRIFGVLLALLGGLTLVIGLVLLAAPAAAQNLAPADVTAEEANLNPDGGAFEINVDRQGNLWISDFFVDEIWQVNPASGAYTVFQGMLAPSDARRDASGFVWWGGGVDNQFGRLDPSTGQANWWTLPDDVTLFGTQIDSNGDFWVIAAFDPYLYRFDPSAGQLCSYLLAADSAADYPIAHNGYVWLGDWGNGRLLKLDPLAGSFTSYQLPADAAPEGMAVDGNGDLWWADPNLAQLARFEPDITGLTQYTLPTGLLPEMVTVSGDQIWYSEQGDGAIGRLDPATAIGATSTLTSTTVSASPTCNAISPAITNTVAITTGTMSWITQTYSTLVDSGGWTVYQLPNDALPWGVAGQPDQVWFVDTGRQILGRIPQSAAVSVTACKSEDADGNIATDNDRTPVQNWSIDLTIDSVPQAITQTTGLDGCTTWSDLDPGVSYGLIEQLPEGWKALTPTSHQFDPAASGAALSYTFINTKAGFSVYLPLMIK